MYQSPFICFNNCRPVGVWFIILFFLVTITVSAQTISTVAGSGSAGFSGDGGAATAASLLAPIDVAFDASGNLYIADLQNQRIRKVNTSGIISTVAGNGDYGFNGDGGAATSASLNYPGGVAVDVSGNLYIADGANNRIRKVNTSGIISTVAGTGVGGFGGDGGAATGAGLNSPGGVAVDASGNVYIADVSNHRIRKVNTSGIISTVAGTGSFGFSGDGGAATSAGLNQPSDVAVDGSGNLYIADIGNQRIRKVSITGIISTVAGNGDYGFSGDGGAATAADLYYPRSLAVDASGNLYIADVGNSRIRKVNGLANGSLALTGVTGVSCTPGNANGHTVSFSPQYSGATGAPISFSVVNEMLPTTSPGPYSLQLYTDNPIITLKASQTGTDGEASYVYNWLSACNTAPIPPPLFTIAAVTGVSCTSLSATSRRLSFSPVYSGATGAPISFSVVNEMLPTTSPGPYTLTLYTDNPSINLRAIQAGSMTSYAYNWLAACSAPAAPLTITGVNGVSCTALSATARRLSFTPTYSGATGAPISFSVVNEMLPTSSPGPYTLTLYTDNPSINLRALQTGSSASYAYDWLAACSASARIGDSESVKPLRVTVLSNPTVANEVSVEICGAVGALTLSVFDSRGHRVSEKSLGQPVVGTVRTTVGLGQSVGVYLLRVQTVIQSQVVKVVRE